MGVEVKLIRQIHFLGILFYLKIRWLTVPYSHYCNHSTKWVNTLPRHLTPIVISEILQRFFFFDFAIFISSNKSYFHTYFLCEMFQICQASRDGQFFSITVAKTEEKFQLKKNLFTLFFIFIIKSLNIMAQLIFT